MAVASLQPLARASGSAPLPDRCVSSPRIGSAQGGTSVEVCRSLETRVFVETAGVAQPCAGRTRVPMRSEESRSGARSGGPALGRRAQELAGEAKRLWI